MAHATITGIFGPWCSVVRLAAFILVVLALAACGDSDDADVESGDSDSQETGSVLTPGEEGDADELHPLPVSVFNGYQGGCPDLQAVLEIDPSEAGSGAEKTVEDFYAAESRDDALGLTDRTIRDFVRATYRDGAPPDSSNVQIELSQPADPASDLGKIISDECGRETIDRSWLIRACRTPCRAQGESATGPVDYYLINRDGHWLIYFVF